MGDLDVRHLGGHKQHGDELRKLARKIPGGDDISHNKQFEHCFSVIPSASLVLQTPTRKVSELLRP